MAWLGSFGVSITVSYLRPNLGHDSVVSRSSFATCTNYGRSYKDKCLVGTNASYGYGKVENMIVDCPIVVNNRRYYLLEV